MTYLSFYAGTLSCIDSGGTSLCKLRYMEDDNPIKYSLASPRHVYMAIKRIIKSGVPTEK